MTRQEYAEFVNRLLDYPDENKRRMALVNNYETVAKSFAKMYSDVISDALNTLPADGIYDVIDMWLIREVMAKAKEEVAKRLYEEVKK